MYRRDERSVLFRCGVAHLAGQDGAGEHRRAFLAESVLVAEARVVLELDDRAQGGIVAKSLAAILLCC